MKKIYLFGNWKTNILPEEGEEFNQDLGRKIMPDSYSSDLIHICLFPPFLTIPAVLKSLPEGPLSVGAQDGYYEDRGPFTGEVSMEMIKSAGCSHVLVGHSERRTLFGDTDAVVAKKLKRALEVGLKGVLCFGETLEEREREQTIPVVERQLRLALEGITQDEASNLILAYEPVWAIGTGKNAEAKDAQEVCAYASRAVAARFGESRFIPVLYGGSVKESNAKELLSQPDIHGALVGGASLNVDTFLAIYDKYRLLIES